MQLSALSAARRTVRFAAAARRLRPAEAPPDGHPGPLLDFVPQLSPHLHAPDHLEPVARLIEAIPAQHVRAWEDPDAVSPMPLEVCLSVPARHGKTTLIQHAIAWLLRVDPTLRILYVSYAFEFAKKQTARAQRLAITAGVQLGARRLADDWETTSGGGVKAAGVDGQITGEGFHVIFVDDPHKNLAEAYSERIRNAVIDGFWADIYTRQDPRGTNVVVVHTRWHERDMIGTLTRPRADEEDGAKPWLYVNLPALGAHDTPLAPRLFSREKLQRLRARVGPHVWASIYQGSPRPQGGLLFAGAALLEHVPDDGVYRYAIGVDLARTAKTRSDHNAAAVLRRDTRTGQVVVVDIERRRCALTRKEREDGFDAGFVEVLHTLSVRYPGAPFVMYTGREESALLDLIAAQPRGVRVQALPALVDKALRATPFAVAWNASVVSAPRYAPWSEAFVRELVAFTGEKGGEDDQVDAAAAAYDKLIADASAPPVGAVTLGLSSEAESIGGLI